DTLNAWTSETVPGSSLQTLSGTRSLLNGFTTAIVRIKSSCSFCAIQYARAAAHRSAESKNPDLQSMMPMGCRCESAPDKIKLTRLVFPEPVLPWIRLWQ